MDRFPSSVSAMKNTNKTMTRISIDKDTYLVNPVAYRIPQPQWESPDDNVLSKHGTYQQVKTGDLCVEFDHSTNSSVVVVCTDIKTDRWELPDTSLMDALAGKPNALLGKIIAKNQWIPDWLVKSKSINALPTDIFPSGDDTTVERKAAVLRNFLNQYGIVRKLSEFITIPNDNIELTPNSNYLYLFGLPIENEIVVIGELSPKNKPNSLIFNDWYLSNGDKSKAKRIKVQSKVDYNGAEHDQFKTFIDHFRDMDAPKQFDHDKIMQYKYLVRMQSKYTKDTKSSIEIIQVFDLQATHRKVDDGYQWWDPASTSWGFIPVNKEEAQNS